MAPELRKRKSKPAVAEPEPAAKKAKATKATPKAEKRKAPEEASPVTTKKQKPSKDAVASKKAAAPAEEKATPKKSALKKEKQSPKTKAAPAKTKKAAEPEVEEEQDDNAASDGAEDEVDDDTNALVEALDSGDEDEAETRVSTYKKGQDVGKVPKPKKAAKSSASAASSGTPGVVYLARIPHGFYEHELRSYFGQFGDVTRLRVVRNKKTGASRHRAFLEFADAEVADIAARTMDKYLLFGHILSAKVVPPAQVHPDLFKGANRRFKVVPWNKMAGNQLERPLSESQWQAKISKEEQRRAARAEKLKDMGYEFDAPALKAAEAKPLLENGTEEEAPKAIEAAPAAEETESKEEEKKQVAEAEAAKATPTKPTEDATPQKKKGKKGKKTKS